MDNLVNLFECLKLRCGYCGIEKYEIYIDSVDGNYTCKCGSHTFTPLNLDLGE